MTKGGVSVTEVDGLTTEAAARTPKFENCETVLNNWNPDEKG